jgi:hypothetical protein
MGERKQINQDRWSDYLDEVTAANRGRLIVVDVAAPNEVSFKRELDIPEFGVPLLALEYDPPGKGNVIMLSTGEKSVDYQHIVTAPVEMAARLNADGSIDSLEILDVEGTRTRLNFLN